MNYRNPFYADPFFNNAYYETLKEKFGKHPLSMSDSPEEIKVFIYVDKKDKVVSVVTNTGWKSVVRLSGSDKWNLDVAVRIAVAKHILGSNNALHKEERCFASTCEKCGIKPTREQLEAIYLSTVFKLTECNHLYDMIKKCGKVVEVEKKAKKKTEEKKNG